MGILHKYIFKQVFGASAMTVALFVFVLVLGNVIKRVLGELATGRIGFEEFAYIVALLIPVVIPYAMPLGMLTGILLVFGRMSAQSEVVAIKAAGRSVFDMSAPVFFLAILASVFSLGINFYYAPLANYSYKSILKNVIRDNPLQIIRPGYFVRDLPGFVVYANSAEGRTLNEFRIWELDKSGDVKVATQARTADISYNEKAEEMVLTLKNGSADYRRNPSNPDFTKPAMTAKFDELSVKLKLADIIGSWTKDEGKLTLRTFGELMEIRHTWRPRYAPVNPTKEEKYRYRIMVQTQIQKNFAMAFSIFSMVVLAVPLGIKASRTETFANLGLALGLALSYYLMTVIISWLEKFPHLRPDILIWIPNFIYIILGVILIIRASKH